MSENKEIGFDILENSDINTVERIGTEKMEIDEKAKERMLEITMKKYEKEKKLLENETAEAPSSEGYADSVSGVESYKQHKISHFIYFALCSAAAVVIITGSLLLLKINGRPQKPQISDPVIEATTVTTSEAIATTDAAQTTTSSITKATTAKSTVASAATAETTTATANSANAPEPITEAPETEPENSEEVKEKEILDAVYNLSHNGYYPTCRITNGTFEHYIPPDGTLVEFNSIINYMIFEAGILPFDRILGPVADEQDAIDKGRYVVLNGKGQEHMDWLEKEPKHDPDIEYVRERPPFIAEYYDEYDVWYVHTTGPSWKPSDGGYPYIAAVTEGSSDQIYIRGCDGKILGSYINYWYD